MSRDIRSLAEQDGVRFQQRPVAAKDGGEFAGGPCPLCKAGEDRFHIWPNAGNPNFWCRQCNAKGDAIDYLKKVRGLSFPEAKATVGEDVGQNPPQPRATSHLKLVKNRGPEAGRKTYRYQLPTGDVLEHVRIEYLDGDKTFEWWRNGKKGLAGFDVNDVPLWNIDAVEAAPADARVVVVEGQKCADALSAAGVLAVGTCGSDTTPNPDVLAQLAGHPLILWADHDVDPKKNRTGQRHMGRIAERVAGLAASVGVVEWLAGPDGGDAADFIEAGHTTADLEQFLASAQAPGTSQPVLVVTNEHRYELELPTGDGGIIRIEANDVHHGRNATGSMFAADLLVSLIAPGVRAEPFLGHLNFLSPTNREAVAKSLAQHFNVRDVPMWADKLNSAAVRLSRAYGDYDPTLDVFDVDAATDVVWSIEKLVEEGQATIFHGDGESLKSYLALAIVVAKALGGGDFCGLRAPMGSALWLDYETDPPTMRRRWNRILAGYDVAPTPGLVKYWPANGRPLRDIKDSLRRRVEEDGLRLLVVDSAFLACGGDPLNTQFVGDYFAALAEIGIASITIAHVTKGEVDGSQDSPFGSVMWKNMARSVWNIRKPAETEANVYHVGAHHKKSNNGVRFKSLGFRITFDDPTGPVMFEAEDPHATAGVAGNIRLPDRIVHLLEEERGWNPTAVEIADRLFGPGHDAHDDGDVRQVRRALAAMRGTRVVDMAGLTREKVWGLIVRSDRSA